MVDWAADAARDIKQISTIRNIIDDFVQTFSFCVRAINVSHNSVARSTSSSPLPLLFFLHWGGEIYEQIIFQFNDTEIMLHPDVFRSNFGNEWLSSQRDKRRVVGDLQIVWRLDYHRQWAMAGVWRPSMWNRAPKQFVCSQITFLSELAFQRLYFSPPWGLITRSPFSNRQLVVTQNI